MVVFGLYDAHVYMRRCVIDWDKTQSEYDAVPRHELAGNAWRRKLSHRLKPKHSASNRAEL